MGKVLTQDEIDAVIRSARRAKAADAVTAERSVRAWDFRAAGQLSNEKTRGITALHENYARNLTRSLGAYLRAPFSLALMSLEQLPFREYLENVANVAYFTSFDVSPGDMYAALQIDHDTVFAVVDVLLGGSGGAAHVQREVTEIEEQIMREVTTIICRELEAAWQPLGVEISLGQRQPSSQLQQFLPPTEKVLILSFEVSIAETKGAMSLILPLALSSIVLRSLTKDWSYQRQSHEASVGRKLNKRLLQCKFEVELALPAIRARLADILALKSGHVIKLGVPVSSPAALLVGGRGTFQAAAVRIGSRRAAQLQEALPPAPKEPKSA